MPIKAKGPGAVAAADSNRQFPNDQALQIAKDATGKSGVTAKTTLEEADLRTSDERELYAKDVVKRVNDAGFTIQKIQIPQKVTTKIIEVSRAIVSFAS
jgi:hypothetical protein